MNKESGGVLGCKVSCFGKDLFEFFVGKHSRLFEIVHGLMDFYLHVSVESGNIIEVVLVNDLLRCVRQFHTHVFVSVQWSVEVHVADVHGHISGAGGRNDTVEIHFECFKACSFSNDIPRVIEDEIASTDDSGPVCLGRGPVPGGPILVHFCARFLHGKSVFFNTHYCM